MADPQIENGHFKIAHEWWDALIRYRIPGEQRQCLDFIIRKTYGWNKKSDSIALSQFVDATGLKKPAVVRAIAGLLSKKIITIIKKDNANGNIYEFIKDFEKWQPLSKKITLSKKIISVIKKDNASLSKKIPTKDTTTKDNTKDNIFLSNSAEIRLSEKLFDLMLEHNPTAKKPNFQIWARQIDLMLRLDKRTPEQIEYIIYWCQADPFWKGNILSTKKLREKFDQLVVRAKPEKTKTHFNIEAAKGWLEKHE